MPLILPYFLSLFYHFLSLSPFFFYSQFLITLLSWVVSPFWSFLFLGSSLQVLTTLLPWVFPLKCFPPLSLPLSVFFSLPCFSLPRFFFPSFFCHGYLFLLQPIDSMGFLPFTPKASPIVFGLLWASFQDYRHTHWLPQPLLSICLLHRYSFHDKIPFCLFLLYTCTSRFKWIGLGYLTTQLYGMHQMVPTIYYFF